MKENLLVSGKGQITLPAAMRRALGLGADTIVTAEQQGGRIVLMPAIVVETEIFGEADIAFWEDADRFGRGEREALEARLAQARRFKRPGAARKRPARAGG